MNVLNLFKILLAFATAALIVGTGTVAGLFWHFSHGLPDHKQLADYQPATASRLYAADGRLLAEYAREKRVFVPVAAMPKRVLEAFVAAEDQRFFTHPGIDFIGVLRAVIANVANPGKRPEGASGITQQVAKNFLLTNQATLARKIREAILAFRIEETYSKERILELYLNEIYLGSGNYGVAQAAINYFDRSLDELTLSEIAYLAALPKAPNRYNIVRNEKEAYARRDYVLGRMLEDGYITPAEMQQAKAEKLQYRRRGDTEVVQADFFAEEVRRNLMAAYGEKGLYEGGLTVIDHARSRHPGGRRQRAARGADRLRPPPRLARALRQDPRHERVGGGVRPHRPAPAADRPAGLAARRRHQGRGAVGAARRPALARTARARMPFAEMTWAAPTLADQRVGAPPRRPRDVVSVGDVIVVEKVEKPRRRQNAKPYPPKTYALRQVPNVEGGVVVMDTADRPRARHVGRLVLRPQPVQPRRPGGAPARLVVQAVRLSRGDGCGLHAGLDRARRAVLLRPGLRPAGVDAQELRRRLSRADHGAPRPRAVAQPDDRAHGPADRHEEGRRGRQGIRRHRQHGRLPADGAGRRRDDPAAHDHGLRHAGQRRARDHALAGRPRAGPQRQDRLSPRAARLQRLRRAGGWQASRARRRSSIRASPSTIRRRSTRSCT